MTAYADLTNLVEILKNVYGDGLKNQFNDEKTTYNQFPKTDRKPAGLGYVFGLRYARTQSTGARAESATVRIPSPGRRTRGRSSPGTSTARSASPARPWRPPRATPALSWTAWPTRWTTFISPSSWT